MNYVQTTAPGTIGIVNLNRPTSGPLDVVLQVRACGICGIDVTFLNIGGMRPISDTSWTNSKRPAW